MKPLKKNLSRSEKQQYLAGLLPYPRYYRKAQKRLEKRQQALSRFAHADIFLFPSCEGGGMVVLEAMAHGLPVVCLDYGGPGKMVTSDCGLAVEVGDVETMVASLAAALAKLAKDRSLRLRMALAAKRRIEECYSWGLRHKVIGHWYARALSNTP